MTYDLNCRIEINIRGAKALGNLAAMDKVGKFKAMSWNEEESTQDMYF